MRLRLLAAASAVLAIPAMVQADSLRIQPVSVEVVAPSQSAVVTLQNTSDRPISLQLRVFEWSQEGGADKLIPTTDVVASPPAAIIPGGDTYTVRIARIAGAVAEGEKTYRLWIDQLPAAEARRNQGKVVDLRLRFDLPMFFRNANAAPRLAWTSRRAGEQLIVEATNSGTGHARVTHLRVGGVPFGEGPSGYILPGSTRRWVSQPGAALPAANANVALEAEVGGSEVRQPITIAGN